MLRERDIFRSLTVKTEAVKTEAAKTDLAATSCEANTWAYLDGKCASGTVRKMRMVRTAPAAGRNSPGAAVAAVPVAAAASQPAGRTDTSISVVPKSTPAAATVVAAVSPQQPVVAPKKPQTSASKQVHRRDQAARNALREVRAQPPAEPPALAPFGGGGFFPLYR